jgi:8-oxo-dGTP pyrophosphatase MutT (NUDIX family)
MGDLSPLAHVKGLVGFNSMALICNKYSATCKPTSTFESMEQKYIVQHEGQVLTFSQSEFEHFSSNKKLIVAAGGLVCNGNGDFLFINRLNQMDLPKGKLELGESESEGALREVEEETGVRNLELNEKIMDTYHTYVQNEELILKRTAWYNMKVAGCPELRPQIEEGIAWVKWINKAEVEDFVRDTYLSIRLVWEHARHV